MAPFFAQKGEEAAMDILIPEKNKRPGMVYAVTDDGIEVPIIDVTHPGFRVEISARELAAATEKAVAEVTARAQIPPEDQKRQLQEFLQGSFLAPMIAKASGKVLGGMSTYFLKLGPDNIGGGYAGDIDRAIAGSLPCLSNRLRLQHMARLLADRLAAVLADRPGRPLHFLNVAGGPGMDSLNTLILLCKEHPDLMRARAVSIHLLDPDIEGPAFGARAAAALKEKDGPLHGLSIEVRHQPYDWSSPRRLRELALELNARDAVIAGSSEGGLFEYGSDADIAGNLEAFHAATDRHAVVVGTVTRADGFARILYQAEGAAVRLRGREAFSALARAAGWRVARVEDSPLSHDVLLEKDGAQNPRSSPEGP
jgi:hypothetical protein